MQGPLISGQQKVHDVRSDRVSFQSRTRSTSTSRKYSTRMKVNVVARSTLMRAFIAMHNAVVRPGYLQQSTWHPARSDLSWRSQHALGLHDGLLAVPVFKHALSRIHVRVHVDGILIEFRRANPQNAHACVSYRCCGSSGFNDQRQWIINLRKLAQARPTMPCIPLVVTIVNMKEIREYRLITCWLITRIFFKSWLNLRKTWLTRAYVVLNNQTNG